MEQDKKEVYSDGSAEDKIYAYLSEHDGQAEGILEAFKEGAVFHTFCPARENIVNWYPFAPDSRVLEVGAGMGAVTGALLERCKHVVAIEMSPQRAKICRLRHQDAKNLEVIEGDIAGYHPQEKFDYIVVIGVLEYAGIIYGKDSNPYVKMLSIFADLLKPNGRLLLAIENRFGLKYWCGEPEDHTNVVFEGIHDYELGGKTRTYETAGVKTFSKEKLTALLCKSGFSELRYYYPLPDYKFPTAVFSDACLPTSNDVTRIKFSYSYDACLIADERKLIGDVIDNHVFPFFANSFFIEAGREELSGDYVVYANAKRDYKKENRIITTISSTKKVRILPVSKASKTHLNQVYENYLELKGRGLPIVSQKKCESDFIEVDYFEDQLASDVFTAALRENNVPVCCGMIDKLRALIERSSSETNDKNIIAESMNVSDAQMGKVLERGYVDMTFVNSIVRDENLILFDQEWVTPRIPVSYILYRAICGAYVKNERIPLELLLAYVGVDGELAKIYGEYERQWVDSLMDQRNLEAFDPRCYNDALTLDYRIERMKRETDHIKQEAEHAKQEAESAKQEAERAKQETERAKQETEHVKQETGRAEQETERAEQETEHIKQEAERVRQETERAKQETEHIKQEAECVRQETERAKQEAEHAKQEAERVRQATERIKQETDELKDKLKAEILRLQKSERDCMSRISELEVFANESTPRKIARVFLPGGTRRRYVVKLALKAARHPLQTMKKIDRRRVSALLRRIKNKEFLPQEEMPRMLQTPQTPELIEEKESDSIDNYEAFAFPVSDQPRVSIIVPVYNQFHYTYLCLRSIALCSGDVPYEVILADDCSTDLTTRIEERISGLHVVKTPKNLRFLLNCNNAAKHARGEYILFLNNDTQVQENWLSPLVELMDRDKTIGMTGSKLLYPDGTLQEAGGIVWRDASAWNYGNRANPAMPQFNYVRDVDYISGAAIMIRKALWKRLGGFDKRFAPAYCEDSDLAFAVRKARYRVVYQPKSVVVHYEGVSNGTDVSVGLKAYQARNQKIFFEKWKTVLERDQLPNGENVFHARGRTMGKKTVLFVDHYVPTFDKDAGSRTVFAYLRLFLKGGYRVVFIGDNFYQSEPYTTVLQQMGVEVLYGSWYAEHWKDWVKENAENFDYAFLNRPHIAVNYIDYLRKNTHAKIVYYGHDLHFLRIRREYEVTGEKHLLKDSEYWREREFDLMRKSDMAYYPSEVEIREVHRIDPSVRVKAIPAYLFDDVPDASYDASERKDAFFIGGFTHGPNVDAVQYLATEIMPLLREKLPQLQVHIAGSNMPEEVKALEGNGLVMEGAVSDERLAQLYKEFRLCVVPLRYGAGIKGKVVESMRYGLPVVTTSCGAEGIEEAEDILCRADSAAEFAELFVALYHDGERLERMSRQGIQYVREHYSQAQAIKAIKGEFVELGEAAGSEENDR